MLVVVHVINQFFAGVGGEEKAGSPVAVLEGASGAARGLQSQLRERAKVIATIFFGDNYFHEHRDEAIATIVNEVRARRPQVVVAGPAFNSGRYGLACVEICNAIAESLEIPCVAAMFPENPAVAAYRDYHNQRIFVLPSTETAVGMTRALAALARFTFRLGTGSKIRSAVEEGYLPRGIRRPENAERPGYERAIDMLLRRVKGKPILSEIPLETWDNVSHAPPVKNPSDATIAIVSTSGVVPWGNPDSFKIFRNTYWRKYSIAGLGNMEAGQWEAVHGGYNVSFMNQNPNYGIPLDILRALEAEKMIGRLYPAYYVVPGNQGSPSVMQRIGREIAADLKKEQVDGVLLVAT